MDNNMDAMLEAVLFEDAEDDIIDDAVDNGNVDLSDEALEEDRYGLSPDQENDIDKLAGIDSDDVNAVDPDEDIEEFTDEDVIDYSIDEEEDTEDGDDITVNDMQDAINSANDLELEAFFNNI